MNLPKIDQDTAVQVVSWILALLVVGAVVYYFYCFPGVFLGLVAGWHLGVNKDKIQDWLDKNSPKTP